VNDINVRSD